MLAGFLYAKNESEEKAIKESNPFKIVSKTSSTRNQLNKRHRRSFENSVYDTKTVYGMGKIIYLRTETL